MSVLRGCAFRCARPGGSFRSFRPQGSGGARRTRGAFGAEGRPIGAGRERRFRRLSSGRRSGYVRVLVYRLRRVQGDGKARENRAARILSGMWNPQRATRPDVFHMRCESCPRATGRLRAARRTLPPESRLSFATVVVLVYGRGYAWKQLRKWHPNPSGPKKPCRKAPGPF